MVKRISRRQLLAVLAAAAAKFGLGALTGCTPSVGRAEDGLEPRAYLPYVATEGAEEPTPELTPTGSAVIPTPTGSAVIPTHTNTPTPTNTPTSTVTLTPTPTNTPTPGTPPPMGSGVVHVYAANATSWDFSTGWYGDYVDQDVVNAMVDAGIMQMTGESTVAAAWQALLPGYSPGQGIAVKVNFNNASCNSSDNVIDALIEPVNALVRSLKTIGVQEDDIWVYDALRPIPTRFRTRCLYPGVRMFDIGWCGGPAAGFSNTDPTTVVYFNHGGLTSRRITDLLLNATYLINMPIIKDHVISCVSLGFKNHFGSIDRIKISDEDHLHPYIRPSDPLYDHNFSPLLKLNINSHILGKTILTLGDGLYGALKNATLPPSRWISFGNDAPNSLFFSTDPIAVDCVMLDILDAEPVNHPRSPGVDDYLRLGADADLGIFERGDPWGSGYTHILYSKITL